MSGSNIIESERGLSGRLALCFLIGGNLVPLLGVFFWQWDIFPIFVLYWLENIIIGIFMILKILVLNTTGIGSFLAALFTAAFFTVHYGMFTMGHGVFVFALFGPEGFDGSGLIPDFIGALSESEIRGFVWAIIGILLAELFQELRMLPGLKKGKKRKENLSFIGYPYARIIILHLTLIGGGLASEMLGHPAWALVTLIILKTAYDLGILAFRMRKEPEAGAAPAK